MKYGLSAHGKTWAILPEYRHIAAGLFRWTDDEIEARVREMAYAAASPESRKTAPARPGIAVIPVHGVMEHRAGIFTALGFGTSTADLRSAIARLGANEDVNGIVLDIDSPGGEVEGLTEIAATIRAVRENKPVIASANTMAASAAYWLGSQASEFVAAPSASVGSIGVFGAHEDISGLLEQEGVKVELISAGAYKTEDSQLGPLSDEARAHKQSLVDGYYDMFVNDVAAGRGVSPEAVESGYGQGRMLLAQRAREAGMIDGIETLDATVGRLAGAIRGGARVTASIGDGQHTIVDGWTDPAPEWAASTANWTAPSPPAEDVPEAPPADDRRAQIEEELEFRQRRAAKGR